MVELVRQQVWPERSADEGLEAPALTEEDRRHEGGEGVTVALRGLHKGRDWAIEHDAVAALCHGLGLEHQAEELIKFTTALMQTEAALIENQTAGWACRQKLIILKLISIKQ